jgi:hypothetical protein
VVTVPVYTSRSPGSIHGATRLSEKQWVESDPLSLVSTIEDILGRKGSGLDQESRDYGRRDPQSVNLALSSSTSGGRSVGIALSRTKTTGLFLKILAKMHILAF